MLSMLIIVKKIVKCILLDINFNNEKMIKIYNLHILPTIQNLSTQIDLSKQYRVYLQHSYKHIKLYVCMYVCMYGG